MKYTSKYTDVLVTPANHIVEILMERKARKDGVTLTKGFWNQPQWKKQFNLCLVQVSAILNSYSEKAVLRALDRVKWAWSVSVKQVKQAIIEEESKLKLEGVKSEAGKSEVVIENNLDLPSSRASYGNNKLNRLD